MACVSHQVEWWRVQGNSDTGVLEQQLSQPTDDPADVPGPLDFSNLVSQHHLVNDTGAMPYELEKVSENFYFIERKMLLLDLLTTTNNGCSLPETHGARSRLAAPDRGSGVVLP